MKIKKFLATFLVMVLLLSVVVFIGQAQGSGADGPGPENAALEEAALDDGIPIQGRLTDSHGHPLNGTYSIKFSLYKNSTGGTAVCTDTDPVHVSNGLFTANINWCTASDISGDQLYLGITVGSDSEMTPRKAVYSVPYARSLRPGAHIAGSITGSPYAALQVWNTATSGSAYGIKGGTDSPLGRAVYGDALHGGTGVYAKSDTGVALKAAGSGVIQSSARSYIFVPGYAFVKNVNSDSTRWDVQTNGSVRIWRGSQSGIIKTIYIPITLPGVLYGQPVKVESIRVYYKCQDGSNGYITGTYLNVQTDADSGTSLISSSTDHKATVASSYSLIVNHSLSANQGILGLFLNLHFSDDSHYVQIGGVRVTLRHN